ncbi:hypothetical protein FOMPIDRAFT_86794 [Fomitopsis schrenkii]|uniref:NADP-dependent oxidoreductase domain-containing protein n=1 Tax=Fomitopsis schrenkii TaxID=2126942 RepID=S8ES29_FOMSC|nr:hypothetical protein FOMPIDRAFT_86794 [Fomitopsis schrenkii]
MGIAAFYGKPLPDQERLKVLDAVYASGCTFWDTADVYADPEELLGKWFQRAGKHADIFLATKSGWRSGVPGKASNGDPAYVRQSADPTVPIEKTVEAMAQLVREGKVKYLGLSECSAETLRRAHAVHPVSALQAEYSAFTLDIENDKIGLLKAARELGDDHRIQPARARAYYQQIRTSPPAERGEVAEVRRIAEGVNATQGPRYPGTHRS